VYVIGDRKSAAIFTDSNLRRLLLLFAAKPRSITQVAELVGRDVKRLHYLVTKLCALGLLKVAEQRKRGGRPIKLYQTVAPAFFIPLDMMPEHYSNGLAHEMMHCVSADAATSVAGISFTADSEGRPVGQVIEIDAPPIPAPLDSWRVLRLSKQQFLALKADMLALLDRYQSSSQGSGEIYLVHAAAARRIKESASLDN
jgi:hypothetical protein